MGLSAWEGLGDGGGDFLRGGGIDRRAVDEDAGLWPSGEVCSEDGRVDGLDVAGLGEGGDDDVLW